MVMFSRSTYAAVGGYSLAKSNSSPKSFRAKLFHLDHGPSARCAVTSGKHLRDERKVGDRGLASNEPLRLRKDTIEDTEDALDLVLVALNCAWDLLRVVEREPRRLAVVRALARGLEEQPL